MVAKWVGPEQTVEFTNEIPKKPVSEITPAPYWYNMKLLCFAVFFFGTAVAAVQGEPPKSGQDLGTITTTDGKTYTAAKLAVIEPDGISILYADGGAKIAFTSLSPEIQKEFGYDPEKGAFFAREQQYLAQIAKLQEENAGLRKRLNIAASTHDTTATSPNQKQQPSIAGFHVFFYELKSQSKGYEKLQGSGPQRLQGGSFAGMTEAEAELAAQSRWAPMPYEDKMVYEQKAAMYGDPIAKQDELDRISAAHPHVTGATVQGSDGTSYNVQYH